MYHYLLMEVTLISSRELEAMVRFRFIVFASTGFPSLSLLIDSQLITAND